MAQLILAALDFDVFFATAILSLFGAVVGAYVYVNKVGARSSQDVATIYAIINRHMQDSIIHTDSRNVVDSKVCAANHDAVKIMMYNLQQGQDKLEKKLDVLIDKLTTAAENGNG